MIIITDQHNLFSFQKPTQYGTDPFKAHPPTGNSVRYNKRMVTGHHSASIENVTPNNLLKTRRKQAYSDSKSTQGTRESNIFTVGIKFPCLKWITCNDSVARKALLCELASTV